MQATTPPQQSRTTLSWAVHAKEPVFAMVAGPSGLVGLGCRDCVLLVVQAHPEPHGVAVERLPGGGGPFTTICFMGSTIVATGSSGMLCSWDTTSKAQRASKRLFPGKPAGDRIKDWVLLSGLGESRLAAACSDLRQVLILDKALEVVQKLDDLPECSTVYSLDWLSETLALVCTDKACVYWNLTEDPPEAQLFGEDEMKITSAACSKDLKRLCVGTANGHAIISSLSDLVGEACHTPPQTLEGYEAEVSCVGWDCAGELLASGDGGEALIWQVPGKFAERRSIICCGHAPKSFLTQIAFHPDENLLATSATDGAVLIFDTTTMKEHDGSIHSPAIALQVGPPGDAVAAFVWQPGGTLIACTTQGNVVAFCVAEPSSSRPLPTPPTCLATLPQCTPLRIHRPSDSSSGAPKGQHSPHGGSNQHPQPNARGNSRPRTQDSQDSPKAPHYPQQQQQPPVLAPGAAFRGSRGFEASQRGAMGPQPAMAPFTPAQGQALQPDKPVPRQIGMQGRLAAMAQHTQHRGPIDQQQQQHQQQHQQQLQQHDGFKPGPGGPNNMNNMANGRRGARGPQPRRGNEGPFRDPNAELRRAIASGPAPAEDGHGRRTGSQSLSQSEGRGDSIRGGADAVEGSGSWALNRQEAGSRSRSGTQERPSGSLDRGQLSPSLMQHIQKMKNTPSSSSEHSRELLGWGMGVPNAAQQMPFGMQHPGMVPMPGMMPHAAAMQGMQGMMVMPQAMMAAQMMGGMPGMPGMQGMQGIPMGYLPPGKPGQLMYPAAAFAQQQMMMGANPYMMQGAYPGMMANMGMGMGLRSVSSPGTLPGASRGLQPPSLHAGMGMGGSSIDASHANRGEPIHSRGDSARGRPDTPAGRAESSSRQDARDPHRSQGSHHRISTAEPPQSRPSGDARGSAGSGPASSSASAPSQGKAGSGPDAPPTSAPPPRAGSASAPTRADSDASPTGPAAAAADGASSPSPTSRSPPPSSAPLPAAPAAAAAAGASSQSPLTEPSAPSSTAPQPATPGAPGPPTSAAPPAPPASNNNSRSLPPGMLGRMHPHAPPGGPRHGLGDDVEEVTTVYVGNLPPEVDEQSLLITFSYFGPIDTVQVIRDKTTLLSRSFAFVTYNSPYAAASAMQHMNGVPLFQGLFQGRALKVGPSHRR